MMILYIDSYYVVPIKNVLLVLSAVNSSAGSLLLSTKYKYMLLVYNITFTKQN